MAEIEYIPKKFGGASLRIISQARAICEDYRNQGFDLTLRQLYYQFVARDIIPNRQSEYKRLGTIINDARLAGLLDWDYIVDRTRNLKDISHWEHPSQVIRTAANVWATDKWAHQPTRVEVWIEKDALVGVLDSVCPGEDVPYFSCRGYTSQSEIWGAAQRLGEYIRGGQDVVIVHLGDHDPSGVDMTRDIEERLALFIRKDNARIAARAAVDAFDVEYDSDSHVIKDERYDNALLHIDEILATNGKLTINRIALNMDQIEEYNPPPNPTKLTDSRAEGYIDEYGSECWELDALDPTTLAALIVNAIHEERDDDLWEESVEEEERARRGLTDAAQNWDAVAQFLEEAS
jgi:hypothetical protein